MAGSDELPPEHRIIGNTPRDETMARLIETTADKLAKAPPPVKTISFLGIGIKLEFNLNTILAACSLVTVIGTAVYAGFNYVSLPAKNSADIAQLRAEIGTPGKPDYIPGTVKGLKRRLDTLEKAVQDGHQETLMRLLSIEQAIASLRVEDSQRFDRLDNRIDRLVETQGGARSSGRRR